MIRLPKFRPRPNDLDVLKAAIAGFVAGIAAYSGVLEIGGMTSVSKREIEELRARPPVLAPSPGSSKSEKHSPPVAQPPTRPATSTASSPAPVCPNVAGAWRRQSDGIGLTLSQNGCHITGSFGGDVVTFIDGTFRDGAFPTKFTRRYGGCETVMHGDIRVSPDGKTITAKYESTNGRCGIAKDSSETWEWKRPGGRS